MPCGDSKIIGNWPQWLWVLVNRQHKDKDIQSRLLNTCFLNRSYTIHAVFRSMSDVSSDCHRPLCSFCEFCAETQFSLYISHKHWLYFNLCPTVWRNVRIGGVFCLCVVFLVGLLGFCFFGFFFNRGQCIQFHSAVTAGHLAKALMPAQEQSSKVGFQCQR